MASKFQNRLVGTVILVAIGIIVLPAVLDGKKKQFKEDFAAIPLVPKPGDQQDNDMMPPVTQSLPAQPPAGAGDLVATSESQNHQMTDVPPAMTEANNTSGNISSPSAVSTEVAEPKPAVQPARPATPPVARSDAPIRSTEKVSTPPAEKMPTTAEKSPVGKTWVIQLGALRNADKVSEVVATLNLSGYRVYTVPKKPLPGHITRIYVGPDSSRERLQAKIKELKSLTKLTGEVKTYNAQQDGQ